MAFLAHALDRNPTRRGRALQGAPGMKPHASLHFAIFKEALGAGVSAPGLDPLQGNWPAPLNSRAAWQGKSQSSGEGSASTAMRHHRLQQDSPIIIADELIHHTEVISIADSRALRRNATRRQNGSSGGGDPRGMSSKHDDCASGVKSGAARCAAHT